VPDKGLQYYQEAKENLSSMIDFVEDDHTIEIVSTLNKKITAALNTLIQKRQTSPESSFRHPVSRIGTRIGGNLKQRAGSDAVISGGGVGV
jgi:hypothetical protein